MQHKVRPRRVPDWASYFWQRADGTFADCGMVCPECRGSGAVLTRAEVSEYTTVADAACPRCRSSGLLAPATKLPDSVETVLAAVEAGGAWLDWLAPPKTYAATCQ